ncbi:MAG: cupin-like domain-containing protein [Asticcacaulis sp.]|uniref:cupin-like domain-containing protein n=1 Tax=Asticcacaulis sp. TaxID=1872648 RepID=UPI0039E3D207
MQPCESLTGVTPETFRGDIVPRNVPVVLKGLGADWPLVRAARRSDRDLADCLRGFDTGVAMDCLSAPPEVRGAFFYGETLRTRNFRKGQITLGAMLDQLLTLAAEVQPPSLYIQSTPLDAALPGLAAETVNPLLPATVRPRLWIGNAVRVQTHYDLSDNIAVVVAGRRRFTLFPPDQLPNLYVGPFENTLAGSPVSLADIEAPDFDRFPKLQEALKSGLIAELEPGDAIYIPYGWWHHVRSQSALNVLVNYWWNEAPAHLQAPYGAMLLAMLMVRDMPDRQRAVWKGMFDHFVFEVNGDPGAHLAPEDLGALCHLPQSQHSGALETVVRGLMQHIQRTKSR